MYMRHACTHVYIYGLRERFFFVFKRTVSVTLKRKSLDGHVKAIRAIWCAWQELNLYTSRQ